MQAGLFVHMVGASAKRGSFFGGRVNRGSWPVT